MLNGEWNPNNAQEENNGEEKMQASKNEAAEDQPQNIHPRRDGAKPRLPDLQPLAERGQGQNRKFKTLHAGRDPDNRQAKQNPDE